MEPTRLNAQNLAADHGEQKAPKHSGIGAFAISGGIDGAELTDEDVHKARMR